jgi:outer membrane protein TolC
MSSFDLPAYRLVCPRAGTALLAAAICAWTACAGAQVPQVLTFEQCVQQAARQNAELQAARANADAAQSRVRAARSGYYPQLSAEAASADSSGSSAFAGPSHSTGVAATQNLFAGFRDEAGVEQAGANERSAQADLATARAKISRDLKAAFAGLVAAQDSVVLAEQIERRLTENLRLVQLRFEGGRENKGSFLLTKATLQQAQLESLQARQAVASAQAQLARVLTHRDGIDLRAQGEVPVSAPPPAPDFLALAERVPSYRKAQAQEEAARAEVRLARAGFYPSLDLNASAAREGEDFPPQDNRRTVGLSLTVPLFSGGRDYYGTEAAASNLVATSNTKVDVERSALVQLKQTHAAFVEAVERLKVDEAFLEAAITRADIARSKYAQGLMSFEDWDRIENDLIVRQKGVLFSRRDRVTAEAAWEQAQGVGVIQ